MWSSLKDYVRKKLRQNITEGKKTGGGIGKIHNFTPLQEKVIEIVDMRSHFEIIPGTRAIGTGEEEQCQSESIEKLNDTVPIIHEEDATSNYSIEWLSPIPEGLNTSAIRRRSPAPFENRKRRRIEPSQVDTYTHKKNDLLEQQAQAQRDHYVSQENLLREINLNILSLKNTLEAQHVQFLQLEEEKLKLATEKISIKRRMLVLKEIKLGLRPKIEYDLE